MSDLPSDYDCIIVGTGLSESILSAALSRIGKTVLHIDRNDYYGDEFSSHSIESFLEHANHVNTLKNESQSTTHILPNESLQELLIQINEDESLKDFYSEKIDYEWLCDEKTREDIIKSSRKFNIDLAANIYFSNGKLVNTLIKSDVSKYCEFKLITRILSLVRDDESLHLEQIPTCRADIFKSKNLSIVDKRLMMQFLQKCLSPDTLNDENLNEVLFYDYLVGRKLSDKVINYLINSIAMCARSTMAHEAILKCKKFLESVGIYGDTPFLYSLYGNGELSQAFCRLSAVFGGVFHLNLSFNSLNIDSSTSQVTGLNCMINNELRKFKCKYLVLNAKCLPKEYFNIEQRVDVSKCILITNRSIFRDDRDGLSFLYLPETERSSEIYLIETSHTANTCPNGFYLVYMTCKRRNMLIKKDFEEAIEFLFHKNYQTAYDLPQILFTSYISHLNTQLCDLSKIEREFKNIYVAKGCGFDLDFDSSVIQAEEIFKRMCPNDEFLPKPPDPEHIIFESDDESVRREKSE